MSVQHAVFPVQIKMAKIIITLKIMPESPEIDLGLLENEIMKRIKKFAGETETKKETEPVAFGLNALKITFVMDENKGSTENLENEISSIEGINSIEVVDVRRAIG